MKLQNNNALLVLLLIVSGLGYVVSCTHDNELTPPPASNTAVITRGNNVHLPGDLTTGDTSEWKFDKSHSSVLWETNYVGASGLLTGRFNQFGIHDVTDAKMLNYTVAGQPLLDTSWAFYESDPAKSYFNGYVQVNTSNTGEPGRDAGCNIGNLGTTAIVSGVQNLTVQNLAKIKTTEIKYDPLSAGYIVTLNFTWRGKLADPLTKTIVGKLEYVKRSKVQFGTSAAYDVFGLKLTFQFNCREFGITSTSISDKIEVECNMNFHNK